MLDEAKQSDARRRKTGQNNLSNPKQIEGDEQSEEEEIEEEEEEEEEADYGDDFGDSDE